jgi:Family of unknown function (DUF6932)
MPLPGVDARTGNLPPGIHDATWDELVAAFGFNSGRAELLHGLRQAIESLAAAGCKRAYIDGSFVTGKEHPRDFDGCWETAGVDPTLLDPVLLDFHDARAAQKERFGGELFPASSAADPAGRAFVDFFQVDREGRPKGIVAINPGALR